MQGWVAMVQAGTVQLRQISGKRPSAGASSGGGAARSPNVAPGGTVAERRAAALAVLGFGPTENPHRDALKDAYRRCALKWHPDRKQNHSRVEEATQKFQEAKEAFDALARVAPR